MAVKIGVIIPKKLRTKLFTEQAFAELSALGQVRWTSAENKIGEDEAIELLKDCEVAIGSWGTPNTSPAVVAACPNLKLWIHTAGSVKSFFGSHLKDRQLTIANCVPAIAECVSEMVLGLLIAGLKRYYENSSNNRNGRTPKPANSITLCGATIGVIGASNVGRGLIRFLQPFRSTILLYDPTVSTERARELGVRKCDDLLEICRSSDAVTLHTPALPATHKMFGSAQFQAMKDDTLFINTSRGSCVDEAALIAELHKGRLTAYLDVSDPEPTPNESPLRKLPNCFYTSHIAGGPDFRLGYQVVRDVAAYLRGQPLTNVVTEEMLPFIA